MTESMIERVARSVFEKIHPDGSFGSCDPSDLRKALDVAAAAINAMRKPTTMMLDAAHEWPSDCAPNVYWEAMIDAALIWPAGSADEAGVPLARD